MILNVIGNHKTERNEATRNKMNTENKTYCGHISRFYKEKHFGFIETEDNNSYFFFVDIVEQNRLRKAGLLDRHQYVKYNSGDEVEFKLKPSQKDNSKVEAYDIKFIRNLRIQKLVDEAIEKDILLGYLKQVDNNTLYVKHVNTYVFIPVDISEWEINYDSVYTDRLNKLVEFKLLQRVKLDKLKAVLTDRIFCKEYYQLVELKESEQLTEAFITGRNEHGVFATILNGSTNAFIRLSDELTQEKKEKLKLLRKGYTTEVKIKNIFRDKRISITLPD